MEIDSKSGENPLLNESEEVEEPKRGMCFSSKQEVYTFYAKYAKHVGFSIAHKTQVFGDDGELRYFGIECSRSGKRTKKSEVNPLKPSLSTKIGCKARVRASLQKDGRFMLTTVNLEHNHDLIPTDSRYFAMNKKILTPVKRKLEVNDQVGNYHSMVVEAGGYESLTFDERDARNYIDRTRRLRLKEGDSDALQKYFMRMQAQNSSFYSMIDVDTDFCIRNLFWADAISRTAYKEFGDVVSFDTTYLTNKYDMPFVSFVGVNHHGQSILLGCGLLCSEDTDTFIWLFKSLLNCMSDHPPKAIITDQCKAMQNAIEIVFPNTRHRWCLWHIMKKIPEKLKGYSQYESIKLALQNAVYDTITKDEFETKWKEMIAEFNLYENEWLGVLYNERHRWVPVYVKDIFWAGISTTQRSESMNAFFDGYVNPKTTLKGIMCAHSLVVLIARCINEVPNKYILPRWRKDLDRGYTCIKTTYTGFGDDFNAKVYDKMNRKFIGIVQVAGNSEGKIKIIDRGLDEIKERVMKEESGDGSNLPCSTKSPIHTGST
ncbi:protein FAR-RED IMPAIRED RESPONSE 1-like [Camellia sinensis]|uniref:protein FAR-RED IMPAIRED RESPONSE 1-like n=1 Tax=Camellia sinensis TaxID=4442 RepID=UPI001035BEB2|nr:protein FAR-RED IMPAIRED RESPONSE 1-like [Camellia sinensis]